MDNKFQYVDEDSPLRCQGLGGQSGQCRYKKVPGSQYCPMHGGGSALKAAAEESKRMYRLAQWRDRMGEFADSPNVKSLREEIGIMRILMENTVNLCKDQNDLLMMTSKISDLAVKLEKLISSCHRLEASTGMLLDKQAALQLASVIVKIIGDHVKDENAIDRISSDIIQAIITTRSEVNQK